MDTISSVTLPVIHIDTQGREIGRDQRTQAIIRIEYTSSDTSFAHEAGIKVRGKTAASYPKKSYAIEFCDTMGEELDVSLFDMRSDGDWILDAMYIDHSRMRNRLCTDIWNAYNRIPHISDEPEAMNGTRGLFVEVFLNGEYNGLYCLTERIDRKQLKLKKYRNACRGLSYKAYTWDNLMGYCSYNPDASKNTLLWNGFEAENSVVTLYDINSRMVQNSSLSDKHRLSLPYKGIYIVHIKDTYQTKVYKIHSSK